jgi:hypothetical protein
VKGASIVNRKEAVQSRKIREAIEEIPHFLKIACETSSDGCFPVDTLFYAFKVWNLLRSWERVMNDQDDDKDELTRHDFEKALESFCLQHESPCEFIMDNGEECVAGVCLNAFDLLFLDSPMNVPLDYLNAAIDKLKNIKKEAKYYSRCADDIHTEWTERRLGDRVADTVAYWEKILTHENNKEEVETQEENN